MKRYPLEWSVGFTHDIGELPSEFIPATVPGAVQLDWAAAKGWPDIEYQSDYTVRYEPRKVPIAVDYEWMEDVFWLYRARLDFEPLSTDQRLFFVCGGVDYRFLVRLNGKVIYDQEGMFTPFEIDLTDKVLPGEILEILVFPVPKIYQDPIDEKQSNQSCKPAFSYGWDFHPRLIPLGIWQDTYLEIRPVLHLRSAEVFYDLSEHYDRVDIRVEVVTSQKARGRLRWALLDSRGQRVLEKESTLVRSRQILTGSITSPELWWPNGQGESNLYVSQVTLLDDSGQVCDQLSTRVGFRRIRLIPHEKSWNDPDNTGFPNSRNKPPITLEINGRAIFTKGSNWVGPDIFPGRTKREAYQSLLHQARGANFNLLRCWGGAPVQKEDFFDLADEMGIMIWQEFPLSCGYYDGTPAYLRILDQESRAIIHRLRQHACLVLWCGGNELFNQWSGMTDQDLALRLLNKNCFDLDPQRPFIMTSPLFGWAHGGYQFRLKNGEEVFQYFPRAHNTGYTEFGVPGLANKTQLERIIPEGERFPPRPGTHWQARHAFHAWDGSPDSWLELWCIEHYFGEPENLDQLIDWSQWMQCEGLKCIFEEARWQKPVCSMALSWCFNEPWPNAANNSLVCWPDDPKPALKAVGQALRPVLASARIPKFCWLAGEIFSAELCLLNDSPNSLPAGTIDASLRLGAETINLLKWDYPAAEANHNLLGPTVRVVLPLSLMKGPMEFILKVDNHSEWDSTYKLLVKEYK